MHFKLVVAFVDDRATEKVMEAAREAGATGITVIGSARGEGIRPAKTFLGLSLETQRDVLLMVVEEHLARPVLERVETAGQFEEEPGRGIAIQLDVEDAVGILHQASELKAIVEEEI